MARAGESCVPACRACVAVGSVGIGQTSEVGCVSRRDPCVGYVMLPVEAV
jgi:hypothetical protein